MSGGDVNSFIFFFFLHLSHDSRNFVLFAVADKRNTAETYVIFSDAFEIPAPSQNKKRGKKKNVHQSQ